MPSARARSHQAGPAGEGSTAGRAPGPPAETAGAAGIRAGRAAGTGGAAPGAAGRGRGSTGVHGRGGFGGLGPGRFDRPGPVGRGGLGTGLRRVGPGLGGPDPLRGGLVGGRGALHVGEDGDAAGDPVELALHEVEAPQHLGQVLARPARGVGVVGAGHGRSLLTCLRGTAPTLGQGAADSYGRADFCG